MTQFERVELAVLYEDADLRVLHKPSGLSVLKDNTGIRSLTDHYLEVFGEPPLLVHRLDKGTSGALIIARTEPARAALSRSFSKGDVVKSYLALVHGIPEEPTGRIDYPLEKARKGKFRIARAGGGLPSVTHYRVVGGDADRCLLEIRPESGRTHQIRVHLQAIGHPLCEDPLYGALRSKPSAKPELTLHAWKLSFPHPTSGELFTVEAIPPDWAATLRTG